MDLKTFVSSSIVSIIEGVKEAQAAHPGDVNPDVKMGNGHKMTSSTDNRRISDIDFDVAVTVTNEGATEAEGKIEVFSIVKLGGGGSTKDVSQSITRLKFTVPVTLPGGKT